MNINELRRKRNAAVKSRNKSQKSGTYRSQQVKRAAHGQNGASVARSRLAKLKSAPLSNLRAKAKKAGINVRVKTMFGTRNKTVKELQNNLRRRGL
jgi:hypothetical protein